MVNGIDGRSSPRMCAELFEPTADQQEALAILGSDLSASAAAQVLAKVFRNIVNNPTEAKYRYVWCSGDAHRHNASSSAMLKDLAYGILGKCR